MAYAHSANEGGQWHDLASHLKATAETARTFAQPFGAGDLAEWAGLWHDLGKYNPAFQKYLEEVNKRRPSTKVPHAIWGAILAYQLLVQKKLPWEEAVLIIAGHHARLKDPGYLQGQIQAIIKTEEGLELLRFMQEQARSVPMPKISFKGKEGTSRELGIRMAFSAIVDSDYLDTEAHFNPKQTAHRNQAQQIKKLWETFQKKHTDFLEACENKSASINEERRRIYEDCVKAADESAGVFRLTVPTGGGKTRSGLAFALKHASLKKLERVIVALPYTSIIDQNAKVYREVLGEEAVVEHHSALEWKDDEDMSPAEVRQRLACENWDAPLIVTTTVQLFESLFSDHPGRCRKLHNLAESVIILDEVQTLPVELLKPTLDVLKTLVEDYKVTLVLSTATQPAFAGESPYLKGFGDMEVREIVKDPEALFVSPTFKRVKYEIRNEPLGWDDLAGEISDLKQGMVVLNSRDDALKLAGLLEDKAEGVYHLSALLCSKHRRKRLEELKQRLKDEKEVRLISTQVVEAGVDIDFPVVYRAMGPLDRIVQAAGRCNREGKLKEGRVVIFETPEGHAPRGPYRTGIEKAKTLLQQHGPERLFDPSLYTQYFHGLYQNESLDKHDIQTLRSHLDFPKVAENYRFIQRTLPVVVRYEQAEELVKEWGWRGPSLPLWRKLSGYMVNLYQWQAEKFLNEEWITPIKGGLYMWEGKYDERKGLQIDRPVYDPSDLVFYEERREERWNT